MREGLCKHSAVERSLMNRGIDDLLLCVGVHGDAGQGVPGAAVVVADG